jgi:hypothetical protein
MFMPEKGSTGGGSRTPGQTDLETVPLPKLADKEKARENREAARIGVPMGGSLDVTSGYVTVGSLRCSAAYFHATADSSGHGTSTRR